MRSCNLCQDPAVWDGHIDKHGNAIEGSVLMGAVWTPLCYLHAIEKKLIDAPLADYRRISDETGYPVNGLVSLAMALDRVGPLCSAAVVCSATVAFAKKQFGDSSKRVLDEWRIKTNNDVGAIVRALSAERLIETPHPPMDRWDFEGPIPLADALS